MDFAINMDNSSVDRSTLSFGLRQSIDTMQQLLAKQLSAMANTRQEDILSLENKLKGLFYSLGQNKNEDVSTLFKKLNELPRSSHSEVKDLINELDSIAVDENNILFKDSSQKNDEKNKCHQIHIVLDNLRSASNVGNIIRSAEALGATHVHLCGFTPSIENEKVLKTSLGCEEWIEIKKWDSIFDTIDFFKKEGIQVYAFETCEQSVSLESVEVDKNSAFVFGNERFGLSEAVLESSDFTVMINLRGRKNSLNVSNAVAIALDKLRS